MIQDEDKNRDSIESEKPLPLRQESDKKRPALPDCVNCNAAGCTGQCTDRCSIGGCSCGGCNPLAEDEEAPDGLLIKKKNFKPSDFTFNEDREPRGKIFATDWLGDITTSADYPIIQVQFKNTRNAFYANPQKLNLSMGDIVAVEAAPGHDIGRVAMVGPLVAMQMKKYRIDPETVELKRVFRLATQQDLDRFEEARKREHDTMIRSRVIAEELGLNMKIGDVEFQGDGSKAIFYYIADERVDFRKLIRILAEEFHVRIEMKQIGARQEAGRIGGIGPCGRPLCCSSWMTHFVSVGTGAARLQDLSMNPQKLAGQCAKLKCCLNFEMDNYAESTKKLPSRDVVLETKDGDYYQFKTDILQRIVTYSTDRRTPANLVTIPASRAFEIIALNKQGIKVNQLLEDKPDIPAKEYIDLTDQDSLTRFDRTQAKKKRGRPKGSTSGRQNEKGVEPKIQQEPKQKGTNQQKQQGNGHNRQSNPQSKQPVNNQSKQKGNPQQKQPANTQQKGAKGKNAEAPKKSKNRNLT